MQKIINEELPDFDIEEVELDFVEYEVIKLIELTHGD